MESLRSTLDSQGLSIAEHQESSATSRKILAEKTREFKRSSSPEIIKTVGSLLKSYQEEVDRLTARAKHGEASFLDLFKKLYEAPDPCLALATGLDLSSRMQELEKQNSKLSQELEEYKAESAEIKNQGVTVRKLEEKVKSLEAIIEETNNSMQETVVQSERETKLEEELSRAQASVEAMRLAHDRAQGILFEMQSRGEEESAAARREAELAVEEMERAQERLAAIEAERKTINGIGDQGEEYVDSTPPVVGVGHQKEREDELAAFITILEDELNSLRATHSEELEKMDALRATLEVEEAQKLALERELVSRPTQKQVDDLKTKLHILQAVGFGALEADTDGGDASIEAALLGKSRKLEHQLTSARLAAAEAAANSEHLSDRIVELEAELADKSAHLAKLEGDLMSVGNSSDSHGVTTETGLLAALSDQRDRLRLRVGELEESLAQAQTLVMESRGQQEVLKADNLALVERLKYVQGYGGGVGNGVDLQEHKKEGSNTDLERGGVVNKYLKEYEDTHVNPFSDFREREKEARRRQLPMQDRFALLLGKLVAGSAATRTVIFLYLLVLHVGVFLVLAGHSHRQAVDCEKMMVMAASGEDPVVG